MDRSTAPRGPSSTTGCTEPTGCPSSRGRAHPSPGQLVGLDLSGALESTAAYLIIGFNALYAPFKGGTLVPDSNVIVTLATDPSGDLSLSVPWPPGVPSGLTIWMQFWISDPAGPVGFAVRHAVSLITPGLPATVLRLRLAGLTLVGPGGGMGLLGTVCLAGGLLVRRRGPLPRLATVAAGLQALSSLWPWILSVAGALYSVTRAADLVATHARPVELIVNLGHDYSSLPPILP